MLLIGFALLRGTAIGGLSLVSQQVVNLWFVQRRGIAAAAASLGLAAGSMVFPRFFDYLIALHGWRGAYLALAVLVALTILPVAAALFRDRPEKFGLTPDAGLPPVGAMPREEPSFTHKEALRTGAFWLLCAIGFLTNAVGTALLLNHFSIMDVAGVERDEALRVLALYAAVQVAATLGTGVLLDRHEPRLLVPLAMTMLAVASALPALGSGSTVSWLYPLCLGGAYGSQQAIGAAGFAQYFGRDHLGAIRGASFVFGISGAAFGPLPFAASAIGPEAMPSPLVGAACFASHAGLLASLFDGRRAGKTFSQPHTSGTFSPSPNPQRSAQPQKADPDDVLHPVTTTLGLHNRILANGIKIRVCPSGCSSSCPQNWSLLGGRLV
jgi:MFS family permease